jgi:tRNA-splicing ligase RtcB
MSRTITVMGDVDQRSVEQLERCAPEDFTLAAAINADGHVGYSMPIGGVAAYIDHVSPSGVGYDIACGLSAWPWQQPTPTTPSRTER